jgi:hypothetical protein
MFIDRPTYGQDSIQVIDLMLQEFREVSFQEDFTFLPVPITIRDPAALVPAHLHQEIGETNAIIPDLNLPPALPIQDRV